MIFRKKGIPDSTALNLVAHMLKSHKSTKKYRVKTPTGTVVVSYSEMIKFVEKLAEKVDSGLYKEIRCCETCGHYNKTARTRGWCSPPLPYTLTRNPKEYCSKWIPMDSTQQHIKERLDGIQIK